MGRLAAGLLLPAVPVAAVMALSAFLFMRSGMIEPLHIAVVSMDESVETDKAVGLVSGMESVSAVCRMETAGRQEALKGLQSGRYDAAVIIPEHFYEDVNTGVNTPIEVRSLKGTSGLKGIFLELMGDAARFISTSEAAIYAYTDPSLHDRLAVSLYDAEMLLTGIYMKEVISRGAVYEPSFQSSMKDLDLKEYYGAAGLALMMILFGTALGSFFSEGDRETARRMEASGVPPFLIHLAGSGIILMIHLLASAFLMLVETLVFGIRFRSFSCIILICLCCTFLCRLVYTVSGSRQESYIIYLMFALFMIISGGYLFPSEFLPEAARLIARLLPLYHIRVMAECAVNGGRGMGDEYWQSLSYCIIFSAAAGILSYVISRFAIYRDSGVRLSQTKEGRGQG